MRWHVRSSTCFALAIGAMCGGCEQDSQLQITPVQRSTVTAVPDEEEEFIAPPSSLSDLAAQSQRDVEMILNAKVAGSTLGSGAPGSLSAQSVPQKTIIWNNPRTGTATPIAASTPVPAPLPADAATTPPSASPTTIESSQPLQPDRLKTLLVDLSRELYASGSYSDTPLRELLTIAAMSMIDPQRQLDPNAIPDLTESERELLASLQTFFADLGRNLHEAEDAEAAIVQSIAKLREAIVKAPTLAIPTAALCTRVGGFGDYAPFEKYTFLAHSQPKAIVYLEIEDFTSELNQKNEYVTQLAQQLTIYSDRDGIPVWKEDWQTAIDVTKNKRQDFFTVQVITLPKALSVGKYQLKIRVRDEQSLAEAETSITFELVADPRMAGK